jgi:PadR family transcriptional regulator PadR
LIRAELGASGNNRRAKYYSLSPLGIKQLEIDMQEWQRVSGAIALVLQKA